MGRVFDGASRARNMVALPWVGDPERWGGTGSKSTSISAAGGFSGLIGKEVIRAQTENLIAVGWDLVGTFTVSGFQNANDTITVGLLVTIGTGQATSSLIWNMGTLSPAGDTPNVQATALGWLPNFQPAGTRAGVALSGQPIIACALNAIPFANLSTTAGAHTCVITVNAHCAPRGWAP